MRRHSFFQSRMGWEMLHKFVLFVGERGGNWIFHVGERTLLV